MIEAAARVLWEHDPTRVHDDPDWDALQEPWRAGFRANAGAVLAAAFEVCEVREERRQRWPDGYALEFGAVTGSFVGEAMTDRRLVITSPAEQVDTEGATT